MGSIFPEKLVFDNKKYRTPALNEAVRIISLECNRLEEIKKGKISSSESLSPWVEREGFEPPDPAKDQRFSRPPHSTALPPL